MKVGELFLGNVEGSEEFKNKEMIDKLYFLGILQDDIEQLISGEKRYIHGYKGTGKTSLIKVLEDKCKNNNTAFFSLSYKKIREDAEVIHEFREKFKLFKGLYDEEEDKDTITLTFWKWYLLSMIAKSYIETTASDLIQETQQKFFYALASVLDMLVVTFEPTGHVSVGLDVKKYCNPAEEESIVKAARSIRKLTAKISEKLNQKVIIFIDEVELTKARNTYGIDRTMIKNLIIASKYVNEISDNLHVVLAVRDEVVYDLKGDEINKLLEDFGVQVSWWSKTNVTIDHALWRLMFKKIRYSMKDKENPDLYTDQQLWERWFPFTIDGKPSWKFLFELTWARPRDFVRLLNMMKIHCKDSPHFTRSSYDLAIRQYSQSAYTEISEEISTLFDEQTMSIIANIMKELGINFHSYKFNEKARKFRISTPSIVLDEMYRVGVIGQNFLDGRKKPIWRFFYRNDMYSDISKPFIVHRALHDALGVKGKFNESVLYA